MTASRDTVAMRASAIHAGYPGVPVLHGVSIEVAAGEMLDRLTGADDFDQRPVQ